MQLFRIIQSAIENVFPELQGVDFDFQPTPENQQGDIGLACFRFAGALKENPHGAATRIAAIEFPTLIAGVAQTGPYVNFTLDRTAFATKLLKEIMEKGAAYGSDCRGTGKKVLLEHTSINPNASPHIGRSRNGLIGDTLARLLRFEDYDVNVHYYVNDMGKQIGLLALQTEGKEHLTFDDILGEYVEANRRAKDEPGFEEKGFNLLMRMEQGDPEVKRVFTELVDQCLAGQLEILGRLGLTYDTFDRESYGAPGDFQGDVVKLPVSGEKRIHNVGLYHTNPGVAAISGESWEIGPADPDFEDRYAFAVKALTSRDERTIALASSSSKNTGRKTVDIGYFSRLNIFTEPIQIDTGITKISITIPVKTARKEEALFVRVHDPAVPSRLWNQFAVKLTGFDRDYKTLKLIIDFHDIALTGGDRMWIDLGSSGKCELRIGDRKNPAELTLETADVWQTVDAWVDKEMISSKAQYSKMYEFMPWQFTGRNVHLDKPYCYGGPFDILLPALAVQRLKPDNFVANFMIRMSSSDFNDGHPVHPEKAELVTIKDPHGAPEWAVYMRDFNRKRHAIADWWANRQNPDGQVGGGWNDDTLFMSFHQADLPLDGNLNAKSIIDTVHTKFEDTGLFKDGYCRIYPIDRMHTGDFISERYNTVVNNLGQAYAAEREMESAWRLNHPDETPVNYAQGIAFKSSVNVFKWYWGEEGPEETYVSKSLNEFSKDFRLYTSLLDDYYFYRMTESNVHRDDYIPYGAPNMYTCMLGGSRGARWDAHLKLSVMWPSGGGPDVARVILRADDTSLEAACYSFDERKRELAMRLCRIEDGLYHVGMYADPSESGKPGEVLWETERSLKRFDTVTLPLPPRKSVVIKLERIEEHYRPAALPDLVIDPWDVTRNGSTVTVTVHNIGNGSADDVAVCLYNGDKILQEKTITHIEAPTDFVAKRSVVIFNNVRKMSNLAVIIDPDDAILEILEENNRRKVK